jgi:pimeloyl-ACP methyl ester carboxylesterase
MFCLRTEKKRVSICDDQAIKSEQVFLGPPSLLPHLNPVIHNTVVILPAQNIRTHMHSLHFQPADSGELHNKEDIPAVFLHGFGACCAIYRDLLGKLAQTRRVYAVDMLGMGLSGKPNIQYANLTTDQVLELFVAAIDAWATEIGLKRFHLIGHSLGGYICSHFAHKKPNRVASLILLSPGGMVREPEDFQVRLAAKKISLYTKLVKTMWWTLNKGWIKFSTMGKLLPTNCMVKRWSKDRFDFKDKHTYDAAVDLIASNLSHPWFSGDILPKIFGYRAYSTRPVVNIAMDIELALNSKVLYVFGEKDWMDKYAFNQEYNKRALKGRVHIQPQGTHHFPCLQPAETAVLINDFIKGL